MITAEELFRISLNPDPVAYDLKGDAEALWPEMKKANITTKARMTAFLANVSQETDGLKTLEEYGDEAYFRSFLGDEWLYHGRGYIMNTWFAAYRALSKALGVDLVNNPDLLATDKELAARAAVWFWTENGLNWWADNGTFWSVCGIINAGSPDPQHVNGWPDRLAAYERAQVVIGETGEPLPTGLLTVKAGTRSRRALDYLIPLIGNMRYWVWESGIVPDGEGAYAVNTPPPPASRLIGKRIFCAAVGNLALRAIGKRVPTRGNDYYDGGVAAYFDSPEINRLTGTRGYFAGYDEPFDLSKAKGWARETRCMVLIGRPYRNATLAGQGHVALLLPSGYVLQSIQYAYDGSPGLNWSYTLEQSREGGYYTRMVHPENWIEYEGDTF